jgi:hypothetical protein
MATSKCNARRDPSRSSVRPAASGNDYDTLGIVLERASTLTRLLIDTIDDDNTTVSAILMIRSELAAANELYAANRDWSRPHELGDARSIETGAGTLAQALVPPIAPEKSGNAPRRPTITDDLFRRLKTGIAPLSNAIEELRRDDPVLDERSVELLQGFEKELNDCLAAARYPGVVYEDDEQPAASTERRILGYANRIEREGGAS